MKIKNIFSIILTIFFFLFFKVSFAEDLLALYKLAKESDPKILKAHDDYKSSIEALPNARSFLFPDIAAEAGTSSRKITGSSIEAARKKHSFNNYSLSLSQPIINYAYWVDYSKANDIVKAAYETLQAEKQSLILRVAGQYFNVLKAIDNLNLASSKRKAFSRYLEQTSQKFKVGLIAITNVHEAKAKRDNALAQEIAAKNELKNQKEILREIIGIYVDNYSMLQKKVNLIKPDPLNVDDWVKKASENNFRLRAFSNRLNAIKKDIKKANAGHLPTLSLDGRVLNARNYPTQTPSRTINKEIGLKLKLPIFQGGRVISSKRKALYNYQSEKQSFFALNREIKSKTRRAYRGVLTQISRVKALAQTVVSSKSALKATDSAFKVGTRTIVDVFNAETDLLTAKRDYSKARYDYILESLELRALVGTLSEKDVIYANDLLNTRSSG